MFKTNLAAGDLMQTSGTQVLINPTGGRMSQQGETQQREKGGRRGDGEPSAFSTRETVGTFGRSSFSGKERSQAEDKHRAWL